MNWMWIMIRVMGLAGYFLLTLSILAAIYRHVSNKKGLYIVFHQLIGQVALLFIGIHACLLVYDSYQPYSIKELLIPFASQNEPILSGMGTIATYLLILVIFTSDFMKKIGKSLWKKIHFLVFPLWFLSTIHGLYLGTDSQMVWAEGLYLCSTFAIIVAVIYLFFIMNKKNKRSMKNA